MTQPGAVLPEPPVPGNRPRGKLSPITIVAAAAGAIVLLVLAVLFFVLVVRPMLFPTRSAGIPLEVVRVSPSTSPLPYPPPPLVEVGDSQVALPVPVTLEVGGESFSVQPSDPDEATWTSPSLPSTSAVWVYGTVVNYVLGLEATAENQGLIEAVRSGDSVRLRLSSGVQLTFRVTGQETVRPDDPSIFLQSRPGLTLVLLGDEDAERLALFSDFDRAEEPTSEPGRPAAGVGQPVQVGAVQVTLSEGHAERGGGGVPAGMMVYLVEFSLQNTGQSPLDPEALVMELVDGVGNRYQPSLSASQRGRFGPLQQDVVQGGSANGTVGYLVPEGLTGPTLTWVFAPQSTSELRARFAIPYVSPPVVDVLPEVTVREAFLGEDGEILHVVARIRNVGSSDLTATAADVSLSSSAGPGELRIAAPPFPWTVAAGQSREVELQFARPEASSSVVTILGYTFEISGLPRP
jgi:hypothetical protein